MNNKRLVVIGKWIVMGLLLTSNFTFYIINDDKLNLILAIAILVYATIEFFVALSGKNLNIGIKLYLFTFYLMAALFIFAGVRSFLAGQMKSALACFVLVSGDIGLILFTLHKLTHKEL
ncbi:MAG TPA: hypothetical protein VJZ06_02595 [Mobilitalea sp.]|nr:hypothetical protein [Mobilitalea sp.]